LYWPTSFYEMAGYGLKKPLDQHDTPRAEGGLLCEAGRLRPQGCSGRSAQVPFCALTVSGGSTSKNQRQSQQQLACDLIRSSVLRAPLLVKILSCVLIPCRFSFCEKYALKGAAQFGDRSTCNLARSWLKCTNHIKLPKKRGGNSLFNALSVPNIF